MTPAPKPRRFRFSLRTLFVVVTLVGCWLGYQLNWIRQRHDMLPRFGHAQRSWNSSDPPTTAMMAELAGHVWSFDELFEVVLSPNQ